MENKTALKLALAFLLALQTMACGRRGRALAIEHPLQSALTTQATQIAVHYRAAETEHGVEAGFFDDLGRIELASPEALCFVVTTRAVPENPNPTFLASLETQLTLANENEERFRPSRFEQLDVSVEATQGCGWEQEQTGWHNRCNGSTDARGNCRPQDLVTEPTYTRRCIPKPIERRNATYRVCFDGLSSFTPETKGVALDFRQPGARRALLEFRWNFEQGMPQQPR